jgi:cellulose synthase/poly-beta-1,6-N-acetylglucosamine synthase-like glycosyltransferase
MSPLATVLSVVFWACAALLVYVYWGYGVLLGVLVRRRPETPARSRVDDSSCPSVSVLLTVYNEARHIAHRITNLLAQDYPAERLEIVVVSDGSTDATEAIVAEMMRSHAIKFVRTERVGKSAAQNAGMRAVTGEIVVLTDAEASFDARCLREMVAVFADPRVGCVTAHLQLGDRPGVIAQSQSRYWRYELRLREVESRLGILAVASGPAMAFRRSLFRDLPTFAGDDCVIPLDVVAQGFWVVHCASALAYDALANEERAELRARVRMTMRNWAGTWLYPSLLNPIRHPGHAFALWSHKLLRWLGSMVLVIMMVAAVGMILAGVQAPVIAVFFAGLAAGALGWWSAKSGRSLPVGSTIYAFLLANLGFLIGLVRAMRGRQIHAYRLGAD